MSNYTLREYIKSGFIKAVGHMADYWIILNSAGWFEKGVLLEDDLSEIKQVIDAQYPVEEIIESEEEVEQTPLDEAES